MYTTPDGLQVTPLPSPQNDLAQAIDVRLWRFDVSVPPSVHGVECKVEAHPKGKPPIIMGDIIISDGGRKYPLDKTLHCLVTLAPTQSAELDKSAQARVLVKIESGLSALSTSRISRSSFQDMGIGGGGLAQQIDDGSFLLLTGDKSSSMWPDAAPPDQRNDVVLVCTFRALKR